MRLDLPIGERDFDFGMRPDARPHGNVTGAVPEAVDITERRQGEEALRQSQKMEAVGQLTGGVAHDFNNLLTIIRSATDFLRRRELPEERRRRYVDAISDTVERASKLTAQLLAFARRQPLKPQIFNVGSAGRERRAADPARWSAAASRSRSRSTTPDCFTLADIAQFETGADQPCHQRPRRHEWRRPPDDRGRARSTGIPALRAQPARGGDFIAISVADTGSGIAPANISTRSSSRSSPPRRSARAPASASARPSASPSSPAATSR